MTFRHLEFTKKNTDKCKFSNLTLKKIIVRIISQRLYHLNIRKKNRTTTPEEGVNESVISTNGSQLLWISSS